MLEADAEVDRRDFTVRVALSVAAGERLALFGPSGAGKTTVLEAIAGLVAPRRARIVLAGRVLTSTDKPVIALPPWQRRVGLLRQDPGLFPHLSVRANLLYGRSAGDAAAAAELAELAGVLGIDGLLSAMPARLSGGQAHRVALGRLLLSHCDALLLDEPYTGLDVSLRRTLTDLVVSLVAQRRVPAILVAHELGEAQAFADKLAVLDRGELLQAGAPGEVVLRPASRRVAELVGYTAFVPVPGLPFRPAVPAGAAGSVGDGSVGDGSAAGGSAGGGFGAAGHVASWPGRRVAAIHPDRVVGGRHPERGLVLAGVVTSCRPAGALWEIAIRTGEVTVTARLPEAVPAGRELVATATDPPRLWSEEGPATDRPAVLGQSRDAVSRADGSASPPECPPACPPEAGQAGEAGEAGGAGQAGGTGRAGEAGRAGASQSGAGARR